MFELKNLYYSALVLALLASIMVYKNKRYTLFIPLIALSLGVEILRQVFEKTSVWQTYFLLILSIGEYIMLSLIIRNFIHSPLKRKIILASIFIMIPVFILVQFTISKDESFKYLNHMIASPLICAWTILYLFEVARHDDEFAISSNPMFWISLGNLLFYSGSLFSYGIGSLLADQSHMDAANTIFMIARILNILLYILYLISFICILRKSRFLSSQY